MPQQKGLKHDKSRALAGGGGGGIMDINHLGRLTNEVVEAARESLAIGAT
jgi:hypothetical protein